MSASQWSPHTCNHPLNGNFRGKKKKYGHSDLKWICSHQDSWIFSQKCLSSTTLAQDLPHLSTLHPLHRNLVKSTVSGSVHYRLRPGFSLLPSTGMWPPAKIPEHRPTVLVQCSIAAVCVPKDKELTSGH